MKFSSATVAAILATVAYSQSIADEVAQIPSCAQTCLSTAITGAGCGITDYSCQCGSAKDAITRAATPCVVSGCSSDDALNTQKITTEICALVAAGGSSSSAAPASSASSVASSASSAAASSASSAATSASSSAASSASSASSAASSASSAASGASSSAASATSAGAGTATSSGAAQQTTNAASKKEAAGVIAGAALLAAFAL